MGFIQAIIDRYQKNIQEQNDACSSLISSMEDALRDAESIFSDPSAFIDPQAESDWQKCYSNVFALSNPQDLRQFKKASQYKTLLDKQKNLFHIARSMPQRILEHNEHAANMKIQEAYALIGEVEGRQLDRQQMTCIVKEAHNHLVIAGAGTGKTTTIVGKIKYLLKAKKCLPEDILVLSFTNASATEMSKRISAETGYDMDAFTFHKLGLNIITNVNGVKPNITQIRLQDFIKKQLLFHMQSDAYLRLLNSYLLYNRISAKSEFEFQSQSEYDEYLKLNPPATMNHEIVKSYGEMDIANFLAQNGITYIYEHPYETDTRTSEYGQYHPDFYLPDYKIYIEYFGINKDHQVPSYFKASNGMTASESYLASMNWKRSIHRDHHTTMIECYAYEKMEGNLLDALKRKLEDAGVILTPKSSRELWSEIAAEGTSVLDGVIELFETLISLIKNREYDIETVRSLNRTGSSVQTNHLLLSLLEPIFHAYCQYLLKHKEIDFNDMIHLASEYVRQGKYTHPYKYVIVDEYQDISQSRFKLLDCMRKSRDYDLFCVGDDWQSIYRFAGSDISFILNFSKYWGAAEISKIETTYRFTQKLIEISGGFIMQNPAQIKKSIRGESDGFGFPLGEISGYTDALALEFLSKKLNDIPKGSSVFFIGRYSFEAKLLDNSEFFSCQYKHADGYTDVTSKVRPDLSITFLTAHKSKGLQADYVFILNNKNSRMGFPSKIQDAPILDLLLDHYDQYPYAEERRLFYVALTRAKKKVFIVTVRGQESEFALELKRRYGNELKKEPFTCPLCGGQLIKRSGPYGEFWGCSNYRTHGCTYKRKAGR